MPWLDSLVGTLKADSHSQSSRIMKSSSFFVLLFIFPPLNEFSSWERWLIDGLEDWGFLKQHLRNMALLSDLQAMDDLWRQRCMRCGSPWDLRDTQACCFTASTLMCLPSWFNKIQSDSIFVLSRENWYSEDSGDMPELGETEELRWEWTKGALVGYFNLSLFLHQIFTSLF